MTITLAEVVLDGRIIYTNPDMGGTMTGEATPDTGTEGADQTDDKDDTSEDSEQTLGDIADLAKELGITPGQLKGRLEASKRWEARAKANNDAVKELDRLRREGMSDLDAAVDKAKADTRAEVTAEFGADLVSAEIRAAAKGRVENVDALIEGIDGTKFLNDDGKPDRDAINEWVDKVAPERDGTSLAFPDLGQGTRTNGTDKSMNGDPLVQALTAKVGTRK